MNFPDFYPCEVKVCKNSIFLNWNMLEVDQLALTIDGPNSFRN